MKLFKARQEPGPDDDDAIEGERDFSPINRGITLQNRMVNWTIVAGICTIAGVVLFKYYVGLYEQHKAEAAAPRDISRTAAITLPRLVLPEPVPDPAAVAETKLPPVTTASSATAPDGPNVAGSVQPGSKSLQELVLERRLKPELRFKTGTSRAELAPLDAGGAGTASAGGLTGKSPEPETASTPKPFDAARAYMLPDPTLMMIRGTVIPCTLQPAIDTTLSGKVSCIVAEDVRGADNAVSLIDAGSTCDGQQGGGVALGQRRVGIIWSRCVTTEHVLIDLKSDAADALGRPGIPGNVDNHFWDRFGAAIALSLISDIGPYLAATRQGGGNGNTTIAFPNVSGPQQVMSEVLKSTLDIPPTLRAPHAARVLIYLAGDLDFRDVYALERTREVRHE